MLLLTIHPGIKISFNYHSMKATTLTQVKSTK